MRAARLLRCRFCTTRVLALLLLILGFGLYCYYFSSSSQNYSKPRNNIDEIDMKSPFLREAIQHETGPIEKCPVLKASAADIDTTTVYPTFDFQPSWLRTKEFWDKSFEDRYEKLHNDTQRPRLKVIVVPHSHNDPGWLKTFEQYFDWKTQDIINNIVEKLRQHPNMTFIWTEISFLNAWWERSHPVKQKNLASM